MYVGIKDGKIYDVCSNLKSKRDNSISDLDYLDLPIKDWQIDDTWNFETNESNKDSFRRSEKPPKTELELLREEMDNLKSRLSLLEVK